MFQSILQNGERNDKIYPVILNDNPREDAETALVLIFKSLLDIITIMD